MGETLPLSAIGDLRETDYEFARPRPVKADGAASQRMQIAGQSHTWGVQTQLETTIGIAVNGATRFTALAGVDEATLTDDAVIFEVLADGETLWHSGALRQGQRAVPVTIDLRGKRELRLRTRDVGRALSQAFADWAEAQFEYEGTAPHLISIPVVTEPAYILTPKPGPAPRINSPRVFGVRPGHPFLFTVAVTGDRPMQFTAEGLPAGLALDAGTGRITGGVEKPGTHLVTLRVANEHGSAEQKLRIEVGERIALTPALGWNSWNCWAAAVDQDKILRSARAMVASGLVNHGWSYINIDDAWQGTRGGPFNAIQSNAKFPDMHALSEAVHGLGLKLGIYSTPWITSYARYNGGSADHPAGAWTPPPAGPGDRPALGRIHGRHSFAANDAKQWAAWGIDYLKYDWSPNEIPETAEMASALRISGRDIVYSLSNSAPIRNAGQLSHLANSWRTTGDIYDTWGNLVRIGFTQDKWRPFSGPGHWNDPDMLVVGHVGWGPKLHPTRLTPDEQYTHITLWCLLSAPLLIGCDLEKLDEFTLNLLTNDEVLEVNQDPLGEQAAQVVNDGRRQVWAKRMEDGSRAIGLFNLSDTPDTVAITWARLGLEGPQRVRDLWRQQDLGIKPEGLEREIPRHGTVMIRVWPAGKS